MTITLKNVLKFIEQANSHEQLDIASALQNVGFEFTCDECEMHECNECDCDEDFTHEKREFLQNLAYRSDHFGFNDMLAELKNECNQLGVNLKVKRGTA